jgi:hypothetical protein
MRLPKSRMYRLAAGALGRPPLDEALERKGRKPQEGIFRSSERDPALSGETAGAQPALSEDDHGLVS